MSEPTIIDMTPEGDFRDPPPPGLVARAVQAVVAIAMIGAVLFVIALALWFALLLVPVVLGMAAVGWIAWSYRRRATP